MTGDHHSQTAGMATLLVRAMNEILGTPQSSATGWVSSKVSKRSWTKTPPPASWPRPSTPTCSSFSPTSPASKPATGHRQPGPSTGLRPRTCAPSVPGQINGPQSRSRLPVRRAHRPYRRHRFPARRRRHPHRQSRHHRYTLRHLPTYLPVTQRAADREAANRAHDDTGPYPDIAHAACGVPRPGRGRAGRAARTSPVWLPAIAGRPPISSPRDAACTACPSPASLRSPEPPGGRSPNRRPAIHGRSCGARPTTPATYALSSAARRRCPKGSRS
jgi:hypothetical protein